MGGVTGPPSPSAAPAPRPTTKLAQAPPLRAAATRPMPRWPAAVGACLSYATFKAWEAMRVQPTTPAGPFAPAPRSGAGRGRRRVRAGDAGARPRPRRDRAGGVSAGAGMSADAGDIIGALGGGRGASRAPGRRQPGAAVDYVNAQRRPSIARLTVRPRGHPSSPAARTYRAPAGMALSSAKGAMHTWAAAGAHGAGGLLLGAIAGEGVPADDGELPQSPIRERCDLDVVLKRGAQAALELCARGPVQLLRLRQPQHRGGAAARRP